MFETKPNRAWKIEKSFEAAKNEIMNCGWKKNYIQQKSSFTSEEK